MKCPHCGRVWSDNDLDEIEDIFQRVEHREDQAGAIFMLVRLAVNGGMIAWRGDRRKVAEALAIAVNLNLQDLDEKAKRGEISLEQG